MKELGRKGPQQARQNEDGPRADKEPPKATG